MAFQQYPQKFGIPSGLTANRPSNPVVGDTYYNGSEGILEIYTTGGWQPCSAPPAQPTSAVATDVANIAYSNGASLSIAFTTGSGGGFPTQYTAYTTAGGFSGTAASSPVIITGLVPGTSYITNVVAQNGFGNSIASQNATAVTATTKPQTPTIGTASTSGVTSDVTVTWTLGNNGGKNLSSITITPYLNGTTAQTSASAATTSSTSHTFVGLTMGNSYTFKVKTTNANGDSPESTATNSVTIPVLIEIDYLVIGGGGGGGSKYSETSAGGGGAGGFVTSFGATQGGGASVGSKINIDGTKTFTITVGGGGSGFVTTSQNETATTASSGISSSIAATGITTITALGGGGGGGGNGGHGAAGGSGGGGGSADSAGSGGAASSPTQGYAGGGSNGSGSNPSRGAGGGGGAGAAGTAGTSASANGAGGAGLASSITGSSVTYAGGGGGASYSSTATGGSGGGGNGSNGATGNNGDTNKGSGGGATVRNNGNTTGGNGGSGVVILRSATQATSYTGSPSTSTVSGNYIYQFNGDGTITWL
jgi:hypothetical protein